MKPKILLIEDSEDFRTMMVLVLARDALEVVGAATGQEGLQLASQQKFDLILVDLGLPDIGGFEVCGELKKRDDLRETPIIILTGRSNITDKVKGFDLGVSDYIDKAFDFAEIRARILAALRTKASHEQWAAAADREHQRTAEELLRISKAVDATRDAVGILDLDGKQIYQNQAFHSLFGCSEKELASAEAHHRLFANPQTWEQIWCFCKAGQSWRGDVEIQTGEGWNVTTFCRVDPVRDKRKEMIGTVCIFTDAADRGRAELNTVRLDIQNALANHQFELWLQPIVPLHGATQRLFEVLLRLHNQKLTLPGEFIPAAERFGCMTAIDRYVVTESIRLLQSHAAIELSINLSAISLEDRAFASFIRGLIEESKIDPQRLVFEITESAMIMNVTRARDFILQAKEFGCRFALDDFGSGFTCFTHLRDLPVNFVKIDGSFVKELDRDPVNRALVASMNEVAHILGKETIAEYVVSAEVLEAVRELGINYGQGWHLGEPAPAAAWLKPYS